MGGMTWMVVTVVFTVTMSFGPPASMEHFPLYKMLQEKLQPKARCQFLHCEATSQVNLYPRGPRMTNAGLKKTEMFQMS